MALAEGGEAMSTRTIFLVFLLVLFLLAVLGIRAVQHRAPHIGAERYMLDNTGEVRAVIDYRPGVVWELGKGERPATREETEYDRERGVRR